MRKKILLVSILVVFMLVTISFASAINANNIDTEKKESPLYRIRTQRAIREKIGLVIGNIMTKILGKRIFFIPSRQFNEGASLRAKEIFETKIGCTSFPTWEVCNC